MSFFNEGIILEKIRQGDKSAFSLVFSLFYGDLVNFAYTFIKDTPIAEEIVQDLFTKFWVEHENLSVRSSLKSYLLRSVQNRCIDRLRHMDIRSRHRLNLSQASELLENDTDHYVLYTELQTGIENALHQMPEEISTAFRMNRFDGLTYREIADKLGVSVRTVEVRIGRALSLLREKLKDYFISS